jgi:tetratricopeptide (TPR) repeat protein
MDVLLETPATRLFIDRAVAASAAFEVNPVEEPVLARICARLDGIPLAIELAATRVRLLSLTELERRLDDRFALLSTGRRSGDARHRTLEATIAWSFDLLTDPERSLLDRLAVFAGGFGLEAVEAIGLAEEDDRDVVGVLGRLVDRSLVARTECADAGAVRFHLLETIRAYAGARILASDEADAVRSRHARYFTTLAETAAASLRGPGQSRWLTRLRLEQDNIRAAIAWAIEAGERETALRLAYALWLYWELDGSPAEGVRWLEAALESVAAVPDALRAKACVAAGFMALDIAEHGRAMEHALTALEISERTRDEHGVALAGHLLGAVAMFTGDQARASVALEGALERFRELGDPLNVAWTLHHLGQLHRMQGRFEAARAAHEESLELYRREGAELRVAFALWRLGIVAGHLQDDATAAARCAESLALFTAMDDASGIAHVTATLGELARIGGDIATATEAYRRSLTMFRDLCDRRCVASSLKNLGVVARAQGEAAGARALYEESLQLRIEMDDPAGIAECLAGLAGLELAADRAESAARLLGAAAAIREALGAVPWMGERQLIEADVAAAAAVLGQDRFAEAMASGRALPIEDAARFALGTGVSGAA